MSDFLKEMVNEIRDGRSPTLISGDPKRPAYLAVGAVMFAAASVWPTSAEAKGLFKDLADTVRDVVQVSDSVNNANDALDSIGGEERTRSAMRQVERAFRSVDRALSVTSRNTDRASERHVQREDREYRPAPVQRENANYDGSAMDLFRAVDLYEGPGH